MNATEDNEVKTTEAASAPKTPKEETSSTDNKKITRTVTLVKPEDSRKAKEEKAKALKAAKAAKAAAEAAPAEPAKEEPKPEVKEEAKPAPKQEKVVLIDKEEVITDARKIVALADKGKSTRNKIAMLKNVNEIVSSIVPLDNRKYYPRYTKTFFMVWGLIIGAVVGAIGAVVLGLMFKSNVMNAVIYAVIAFAGCAVLGLIVGLIVGLIQNPVDRSKHVKQIKKELPEVTEYYSKKLGENADKLAEFGLNASKLDINIQVAGAEYVFEFQDPSYYARLEENKAKINAEVDAIKVEIKKAEAALAKKLAKTMYSNIDCSSMSELRAFVRNYDASFVQIRESNYVAPEKEEVVNDDEPKISLGMQLLKQHRGELEEKPEEPVKKEEPKPEPVKEEKKEEEIAEPTSEEKAAAADVDFD